MWRGRSDISRYNTHPLRTPPWPQRPRRGKRHGQLLRSVGDFIPPPPPPHAALIRTGSPMSCAISHRLLIRGQRPLQPGTTGMPENTLAVRLAWILSPSSRYAQFDGPMKSEILCSCRISATRRFSERKPSPGCRRVGSGGSHKLPESPRMFDRLSRAGGGPMHTLSSASRTCMASSSAVECTATEAITELLARAQNWKHDIRPGSQSGSCRTWRTNLPTIR